MDLIFLKVKKIIRNDVERKNRAVPRRVQKIYGYISETLDHKKIKQAALAQIVLTVVVARLRQKPFFHHVVNHSFYKKILIDLDGFFKVDVEKRHA